MILCRRAEIVMKQCSYCKQAKPLDAFPRCKGRVLAACKLCRRERARFHYRNNKDSLAVTRYKNYRHTDKQRGFSTISRKAAVELMQQPCHWCGEEHEQRGLDRIDHTLGHSDGNVVPCCGKCNEIRGSIPFEAMEKLKDGLREIRETGLLDDWEPRYKKAYFKNRQRVRYE